MKCPYLWGVYLRSCSAARDVYVPDAGELKERCSPAAQATGFPACPIYRSAALTAAGGALPFLDRSPRRSAEEPRT